MEVVGLSALRTAIFAIPPLKEIVLLLLNHSQDQLEAGRIMSMKHCKEINGNQARGFPEFISKTQQTGTICP
jgi:hypothetical protein